MAKSIVEQLDPIFKAGSIAVIGASKTPPKWGFQMVDSPLRSGFRGPIYPVNPKEKEIRGLPCYPSVRDIPYGVDMAVMAIEGAETLAAIPEKYGKPVITPRWRIAGDRDIVQDIVRSAGIPAYESPEQCARAMHALATYAHVRRELEGD